MQSRSVYCMLKQALYKDDNGLENIKQSTLNMSEYSDTSVKIPD